VADRPPLFSMPPMGGRMSWLVRVWFKAAPTSRHIGKDNFPPRRIQHQEVRLGGHLERTDIVVHQSGDRTYLIVRGKALQHYCAALKRYEVANG
jgi:hypothetical protein